MRVRIINQPAADCDEWLGYNLRSLLESKRENGFVILRLMVAFVKTSGLIRIASAMDAFRENGGHIEAVVGVDSRGTSKQALRMLYGLADEVYVYHDTSLNRTFHPKLYLLANPGNNAIVLIGSSNLTAGGLFTNYEIMTQMDLDLANPDDCDLYKKVNDIFTFYEDVSTRCSVRLSEEFMNRLESEEPSLLLDEETDGDESGLTDAGAAVAGAERQKAGSLFGTRKFAPAPQPDLPASRRARKAAGRSRVTPSGFWKVLSNFDVNPGSAPGQIIVPIRFAYHFPQVTMTQGPDAGGKGRQWECSLSVLFSAPSGNIVADDARFIIYEPHTGHPRPNTESRFTFHNRGIFNLLSAGDMLIFQRQTFQYWFRVTLAHPGSRRYQSYRGRTDLKFGEI
jgi:HKD family nuclease